MVVAEERDHALDSDREAYVRHAASVDNAFVLDPEVWTSCCSVCSSGPAAEELGGRGMRQSISFSLVLVECVFALDRISRS